MIRYFILGVVIFSWSAASAKEPEKLVSLRQAWADAITREINPLNEKYGDALEALRKKLTQQGRIEDAVLVRDEIQAIKKQSARRDDPEGGTSALTTLRNKYHRERDRIHRANQRKYVAALRSLEAIYRKKGELDPIVEIIAELKRLTTAAAIPKDAVEFDGHSYFFFEEKLTWEKAMAKCRKLQGHLVTIESGAEDHFVKKLTRGQDCWLGAADADEEGVWKWTTGEPFTFSGWADGQPDNHKGVQHYALYWNGRGWDDMQGNSVYRFMCEWDQTRALP